MRDRRLGKKVFWANIVAAAYNCGMVLWSDNPWLKAISVGCALISIVCAVVCSRNLRTLEGDHAPRG